MTDKTPSIEVIERARDLLPFDQVDEGIFVRELLGVVGVPDFHGWIVAPLCWEYEHVKGWNEPLKRPVWGEPIERPMTFPMTVVRGLTPPPSGSGGGHDG